jgi:hypothetical protein
MWGGWRVAKARPRCAWAVGRERGHAQSIESFQISKALMANTCIPCIPVIAQQLIYPDHPVHSLIMFKMKVRFPLLSLTVFTIFPSVKKLPAIVFVLTVFAGFPSVAQTVDSLKVGQFEHLFDSLENQSRFQFQTDSFKILTWSD